MAECKRCGRPSDTAKVCPACRAQRKEWWSKVWKGAATVAVLIGSVAMIIGKGKADSNNHDS